MGQPQTQSEHHHTYADHLQWPEVARYELIDGVAHAMTPAASRSHQRVVVELSGQVATALQGSGGQTYVAPFNVRLPKGDEVDPAIDTVLQPDVLAVCDLAKVDERGVRGAPDWDAEVLSPASAGRDQTVKLAAYERAGVPEVCLLHPTDRVLTIDRLEGALWPAADPTEAWPGADRCAARGRRRFRAIH